MHSVGFIVHQCSGGRHSDMGSHVDSCSSIVPAGITPTLELKREAQLGSLKEENVGGGAF